MSTRATCSTRLLSRLGGGALATQYLFQEPALVTWKRYLATELTGQQTDAPSPTSLSTVGKPPAPAPREVIYPPVPNGTAENQDDAPETVEVTTVEALRSAVLAARPGQVIALRPGLYEITGPALEITTPGRAERRITLRGSPAGATRLELSSGEGFRVGAPYWTFENLMIDGTCPADSRCEHAFHVVGNGSAVVIRNNRITNFNAAVKVNGEDGRFPDDGLIEGNLFYNDRIRQTGRPVATLDIVAVNGWHVRGNMIADFAKAGGDRVSYGAFFKGGGSDNVFEQNVVRCEWRHSGATRVGFSFGGGSSSPDACRDGACAFEHSNGIARNNVILNCPNDVGIYLNSSAGTLIYNNAVIGTRGIDVRFPGSTAEIFNNVIDGRILARDGGSYTAETNLVSLAKALLLAKISRSVYSDPAAGDLRLIAPERIRGLGRPVAAPGLDVCGRPYGTGNPDIGPIQYAAGAPCAP